MCHAISEQWEEFLICFLFFTMPSMFPIISYYELILISHTARVKAFLHSILALMFLCMLENDLEIFNLH